jgi:hypothetical protein
LRRADRAVAIKLSRGSGNVRCLHRLLRLEAGDCYLSSRNIRFGLVKLSAKRRVIDLREQVVCPHRLIVVNRNRFDSAGHPCR